MDGEVVTKAAGLFTFGVLFLWMGINGWQDRRKERISMIEAAVLKLIRQEEPLPFNTWDRAMAYIQPILMLIFGPCMMIGAVAMLMTIGD